MNWSGRGEPDHTELTDATTNSKRHLVDSLKALHEGSTDTAMVDVVRLNDLER